MRIHHRVTVASGLLGLVVGLVALTGSSSALRITTRLHVPPTTVGIQLGAYDSSTGDLTEQCSAPKVDLDPALKASGPEVAVVQTLLGLPSDGSYGPETASAVSDVQCPPVGLYAALQALLEVAPALRDQATARNAPRASQGAVVANPSQACTDAAAVINAVWAGTGQEAHALNVVQKESGCTDTAYNSSGASGLFQLLGHQDMVVAICGPGGSAFDPVCNAKVALQLYQGSGWSPWAASGG